MMHFIRRTAAASAYVRIPVDFSKNTLYDRIRQLPLQLREKR